MDPNTRALIMGAAGAGGAEKLYVEDVFSTYLYTGTGSTQTITNGIDLAGEGGMVWLKARSLVKDHCLIDTNRGSTQVLRSNTTDAEFSSGTVLTAFNSNGFSLGSSSITNTSGATHVSWTFRKAAKFFDVVTYTGDGTNNRQIAHSLGSKPGMVIVKRTDSSSYWVCWHRSLPNTGGRTYNTAQAVYLHLTNANNVGQEFSIDGSIDMGSSTFVVSNAGGLVSLNTNGAAYVAYLFAHDAGGFGEAGDQSVIKCGSFTTDGSAVATVDLGWEPQWILFKRTDSSTSGEWYMLDTMRGWCTGISSGSNDDSHLWANSSNAESTPNGYGDVLPTGFLANGVASNATFIYIAIRRGPMKTPTDATTVFKAVAQTSGGTVSTDFPVDMVIMGDRPTTWGYNWSVQDRLRGKKAVLFTSGTGAENTTSLSTFDSNTSFTDGWVSGGTSAIYETFRRAPGFFDVVAYTGVGSGVAIPHNLGVAPQMIIVKNRGRAGYQFVVWTAFTGTGGASLNGTGTFSSVNMTPTVTSSTITYGGVGYEFDFGASDNYIAYLFATCPGVSKVGSYTGTGFSTQDINCGFTAGARFVLIKRTDSTGDWYVWDTARGIILGNDPYLLLNSTAAEVTNTDYLTPLNAGFQVYGPNAWNTINVSGATYIYLAIA